MEKAREFQKNIYFCFTDYAKAFDSVDHNKLWKILKEIGILDHLTCLWRNLYAGLEFQLQHHSLQRNPRADLLQNGLVGSPCSPGDSQESSPTPQFKSINSSVLSLLHRLQYLYPLCIFFFLFSGSFDIQSSGVLSLGMPGNFD